MNYIHRKHVAEAFGTFLLSLVVSYTTLVNDPLIASGAVLAAVIVGLFVYTIGALSGTHLNPAVTLAVLSARKITQKDALYYIIAQLVGALVAGIVAGTCSFTQLGTLLSFNATQFIAEVFGTMVLMFGISSVIYGVTDRAGAPFVIGGSLFVGATLGTLMGGLGVLNPAVALALNALTLSTVAGPLLGAAIAIHFFKLLEQK